jgi:hypothetical protein
MKKNFLNMLALGAILVSASCSKEDPAKALDDSVYTAAPEKQATIQGKLLVNSNTALTEQVYSALSGITVIATIPYSNLNSSASGSSGAFSTSTTTNSSGEFTLKVPATASGVPVTLTVNDKDGKQRQQTGTSPSGSPTSNEISGKWSFFINDYSLLSVKSGQTIILESIKGQFTPIESAGDPIN